MRKLLFRAFALMMTIALSASAAFAQKKAPVLNVTDAPAPIAAKPNLHFKGTKANALTGFSFARANKPVMLQRNYAKGPAATSSTPTFTASTVYTMGVDDLGMYSWTTSAPAVYEPLAIGTEYEATLGGCVTNDGLYYLNKAEMFWGYLLYNYTFVFNYETWEMVDMKEQTDLSNLAFDMTYDDTTDNIYGCFYSADGSVPVFGIFDPETLTTTHIADLNVVLYGLAACDGVIYGFTDTGDILKVDKATGALTAVVSDDMLATDYLTTACADPVTGIIYYAPNTDDYSYLCSFDPKTNEIAIVYDFPNAEEIGGMAFAPKLAEPGAPAQGSIDELTFTGKSLTGSIRFTAPSAHYDGSKPAAGETLRYNIVANDIVLVEGKVAEWGHSYHTYITVPESGMYNISVIFYNEVGPSPAAVVKNLYIGADSPAASESVVAQYTAGKMNLTWDAVTTGAHDGLIGTITYDVYDAEGTQIAAGLTETSYTFALAAPKEITSYQYYVVAVSSDGTQSEPAYSNIVVLGAMEAPYESTLGTEEAIQGWTIEDLSGGNTWTPTGNEAGGISIMYDTTIAKDDWLISPPFEVQSGKKYTISFEYKGGSNYYPEKLEVYTGNDVSVDAMTNLIFSKTLKSSAWTLYTYEYVAPADGRVVVGFHSCSEEDMLVTYLRNFSISKGYFGGEPAAATNLNVVVPTDGTPKGQIAYENPTLTVDGSELTSITRVEIYVNGEIIYVDNQPTVGAFTSVEYNAPASGSYEFKVVAYNELGAGEPAIYAAYLGVNVPGPATNATFVEVSDGVVNISWDAPEVDIDGNYINPDLITYTIYDLTNETIIAEGVSATTYENYTAVPAGAQEFCQFAIISETEMGMADDYAYTDFAPVGTPYPSPYYENGVMGDHILGYSGTAALSIMPDAYIDGLNSHNNDGAYFGIYSRYIDDYAVLYTGKVAVTDADAVLTFYQAAVSATSSNTIEVVITCEGEEETHTFVQNTTPKVWVKNSIDLSAYAGKTITLSFIGTIKTQTWVLFDDIRVGNPINYNLVAEAISAPGVVTTENAFDITYTVYNDGFMASGTYNVSLYADGDLVETAENLESIEPGESYTGTFNHEAYGIFETGEYTFNFVVDYPNDQEAQNNASVDVKVKIVNSDLPVIELEGQQEGSQVTLSWDTPAIDVSSMEVTEGFESASYPAFTTDSFAGWTLANYNENATYVFSGLSFPNMGSGFGWILFDTSEVEGLVTSDTDAFAPYEGSCYMAAFAHQNGANDAWLISPSIDGSAAQTITFMAKSATADYGLEKMECYYTTGSMATEDFIQVSINGYSATGVPAEWTEYSIDLPAGATNFAIRSISYDVWVLMIDAVTYPYSSPYTDLELSGFDIYRNAEKIGTAGVNDTQYVDTLTEDGDYTYQVVVVYNNGNSAPSNKVEFNLTGIEEITLEGAEGIFYNIQGIQVENPVRGNVYIRVVDGKASKVYVK